MSDVVQPSPVPCAHSNESVQWHMCALAHTLDCAPDDHHQPLTGRADWSLVDHLATLMSGMVLTAGAAAAQWRGRRHS